MKQEWIRIRERETAARVQGSRVEAVRLKDITKKAVRVYQDGKIGIAGVVGDADQAELLRQAQDNLSAGIQYPYPLTTSLQDHRSYNDQPYSSEEVVEYAEQILKILREEYEDFSFSEVISGIELEYEMGNSEGLDLLYKDAFFVVSLMLKEKASANIIDGALICHGRRFDLARFLEFNRSFLEAYRTRVELPQGEKLPVFTVEPQGTLEFIGRNLHGERFAKGSSLFSGKLGQQLFSERITIELSRNPLLNASPFFDAEGVVLPGDSLALIEQGRLSRVLTDKKTAQLHNLPHTGAAVGAYDDVPTLDGSHARALAFKTDSEDLAAALQGQPAILAFLASGGDFTADGSYATPVQVAFLFDGKRILGRLPEFAMRSHLDKMLGEDYIGTFENTAFYFGDMITQLQGYYMTIDG